uniref:Uncharacterized protein n=1 Tax=Schistosoma japonicum TaxID=6182 RepID=Q5C2Z3_SCHJA|nr:unknown [Schistosoma japonicum]
MRSVKPVQTRQQSTDTFIQPALKYSTHVFVLRDAVRRPLDATYEGPYKVLKRETKYYTIDKNGHEDNVSIDRLKAAYLEGTPFSVEFAATPAKRDMNEAITPQAMTNTQVEVSKSSITPKATRSGRKVRFPEHLNEYYVY